MNRFQLSPQDALALICLIGITVGVANVFGVGWALIVVSALVLLYLIVPDQRPQP